MQEQEVTVSVVMPCLNEEGTIGICIEKIKKVFTESKIKGEIIVCDNGSTDNSAAIATRSGVKVVHQPLRGYGAALLSGFSCAQGKYLIMVDADDTYDFDLIPQFLEKLINEGYAFVTGSRYLLPAGVKHLSFSHRFIGNPLLTALLNYMFGVKYTDVYCGYRALSRQAYEHIKPVSRGMEFNLELAINAWEAGLKIAEIPITLGFRKGKSKLRTVMDGWRSIRMMLLYCPNKIFLWPGFLLLIIGTAIHLVTLLGFIQYEGRSLGAVTGIFATIFSTTGLQILILGLYAKTYSWSRRFDRENLLLLKFYRHFKLEGGLALGTGLVLVGAAILMHHVIQWVRFSFEPLAHPERVALAATLIIMGFNIVFSSLFISAMSLKER